MSHPKHLKLINFHIDESRLFKRVKRGISITKWLSNCSHIQCANKTIYMIFLSTPGIILCSNLFEHRMNSMSILEIIFSEKKVTEKVPASLFIKSLGTGILSHQGGNHVYGEA